MTSEPKVIFKDKAPRVLPYAVFAVLITATIAASYYAHATAARENTERFAKVATRITNAIKQRIEYYEASIKQTAALFMQNDQVTSNEFKVYAQNVGVVEDYPGMTALGYTEFVKARDLNQFIQQMRREERPNYNVWPREESGRSHYAPVKYVEPYFQYIKPLSGFDMMSDPQRHRVMVEAATKGASTVTEEVALFSQSPEASEKGFNIFYPVYKENSVPQSEELRMAGIKGYVFGVFNGQHLFNIIMEENNFFRKSANVEVVHQAGPESIDVYSSNFLADLKNHNSMYRAEFPLKVANEEWILKISSLPNFEKNLSNSLRWYILFSGGLFSLSVFYVARRFLKAKKSVENSEKQMRKTSEANALLARASQTLGVSLDTQTNLEKLAEFFTDHFADCCVIYFSEEGDFQPIVSIASEVAQEKFGSEDSLKQRVLAFVEERSLKDKVLRNETHILENEPDSDLVSSCLSLPLTIRSRLYKIITLINIEDDKDFSQRDVELLTQLTNLAAVSVENTLLYNEAQLANRLKDEFLATVSHELRTPLNVIYGHSQLLLESDLPEDERSQVEAIFRSAKAQSAIIEDLLDISSIISGKVKFQPRPVKIIEAIDTAIESVKLEAERKGIELIYEESSQCIIMGAKTRLVQILWNLLSNAIKFTPKGGKVAIKTKVENDQCIIKVMDTGKGIDPVFLPFIFEKFRQEEKASTRSKGGLGLGLSIVHHLVDLHGGTINVQSEGLNKGTTFTISFPLVSLTARSAPREESEKIKDIKRHDLHDISILTVDDEPDSLNLITRILRSHKAIVITAANAKEALKKLKTERPDVLISDIAMPEMDGYELIKEVRKNEKGQGTHIPAIALTAFAQEEDKQRALKSGYEAYLTKPVNKEKLIDTVEKTLQ